MHTHIQHRKAERAATLLELIAVLAVIALCLALLAPWHKLQGGPSNRIHCVNNLKNIGLACRTFAVDYGGAYPWEIDPANGGFALPRPANATTPTNNIFFLFATLSNELSTPKILLCPSDSYRILRMLTNSWAWGISQREKSAQIPSYFIGPEANQTNPRLVLGGDRNLSIPSAGLDFRTSTNYDRLVGVGPTDARTFRSADVGWTSDLHNHAGNILLGDGSVQQESDKAVRRQLQNSFSAATNGFSLFFPAL